MFSIRRLALVLLLVLTAGACSSDDAPDSAAATSTDLPRGESRDFGSAPAVPIGDLAPEVSDAVVVLSSATLDAMVFEDKVDAIDTLGGSSDPRVGWVLSDLLRIARDPGDAARLAGAATELLGPEFSPFNAWGEVTDHLIGWDVAAPPGYLDAKRAILMSIVPEWEPFFDESADIDWRTIVWGGVRIDDRPYDTTDDLCNCIPAADNPEVQPAAEATWLEDDDVVFGVVINGESRAYPRQIMEVREMVNDTLGGRDFAMPYCTLCGSAQVWFTDNLPEGIERPILRTSGLLARSNKVMFDLNTFSIFDTFLGTAQSGPLAARGISLDQHSVVTSTWAEWRAAHPDTTVLIEELSLGRDFDFRNNRDADGPIFPVGAVDPRLPVQEDILGVTTASGTPLAFHVSSARAALEQGQSIEVDGITLVPDGGGVRAVGTNGEDAGGHQAFWFAWSQFHPDTELWPN